MAVFHSVALFLIIGGVVAGIVFSTVPGLSASTTLALFLPIIFGMEPTNGVTFPISIYVGGLSGGLISAILLGISGTPSSIVTRSDGYPIAQRGEAGKALGTAIALSFIGGVLSVLMLTHLGPVIAGMALKFGPHEYFAVIFFTLTTMSGLSAGNINKELLSCLLGTIFSFVGIDRLSSYIRYMGGISSLAVGFSLILLLIGTFAVSQTTETAIKGPSSIQRAPSARAKGFGPSLEEFVYQLKNAIPAALVELSMGILPGIGGSTSDLLAYASCKERSKHPKKSGTGVADGIVASETADNATIGGVLIILLALGIPEDNATSMMLTGFQIYSITPGSLLFETSANLVYALFAVLIVANTVMMVLEFLELPLFAKVLSIPGSYPLPMVITCCLVGLFSTDDCIFDILAMVIFGLVGYMLRRWEYPLTPMMVGLILAPLLEENAGRSLVHTEDSFLPILTLPIALTFFIPTAVMAVLSVRSKIRDRKKQRETSAVQRGAGC